MKSGFAAILLLSAGAAFCGDAEFDRVVKAIESRYGTQRTHIPLMGVANFFVKVRHPEGASSFKLAVFEDLQSPAGGDGWGELDRFMDTLASGRLRPVVRTHSRRGEESTYILAGPAGKSTRMLIASFESNDATVVEVTVNTKTLLKAIADPEHADETVGLKRKD